MSEISWLLFLCGALGAFVKDIVHDNCLHLPKFKEGRLYLGFLGGGVVGGFVGFLVDHSYVTAMLAGYAGKNIIEQLLKEK